MDAKSNLYLTKLRIAIFYRNRIFRASISFRDDLITQIQVDLSLGNKLMIKRLLGLFLLIGFLSFSNFTTLPVLAVDLARQPAIEVKVSLGNELGELRFFPDHLKFIAGKRYKLVLTNPSSQKHYFTAKDFADAIWSQKVDAGNVEIKGAIHEIELRPGTTADWVFVPVKTGTFELHCSVPGHTEAGMKGQIEIVSES